MLIDAVSEQKQIITVSVPLTTTSGKTRVKQRDSVFGYGLPFASRTNKFNLKNYIEWQIGYDAVVPKNEENYDKKKFPNYDMTTLKNIYWTGSNGKNKTLYELSEYLYYFIKWGIILKKQISTLKTFLEKIDRDDLLDNHQHCQIKRTNPSEKNINNLDFLALRVEYPQLIYKFKQYEIIAEITIREKQRAVGTQPMLYFCYPITELQSKVPLIGRCANKKEFANFEFNSKNSFIILDMIKIFGMLSPSHQFDTLAIIETILKST
jgi:hypothetical protein